MSGPVVDMELRPKDAIAVPEPSGGVSIFERLARDPSVDVDKLEKLMQLHERVTAREAEGLFNAAMSDAQKDMRPVAADANNPQTRSRYASYEALDRKIRPIYTKHGFGLSFDSEPSPAADYVRVLCYVTHSGGHARTYKVDMPADGKGAKGGDVMTKTHAVGAAMSYGMRYLLKMIFNVAVGEDDHDGNDPAPAPDAPDGYDGWLSDLTAVADEGIDALWVAWKKSPKKFCEHITRTEMKVWNDLKIRAAKVPKPSKETR